MQEQDQRSLADARIVQAHTVHVHVTVLERRCRALREAIARQTRREKNAQHQPHVFILNQSSTTERGLRLRDYRRRPGR